MSNGKSAYERYCQACHGKTGKGDGPGARISGIMPTDLTIGGYQSLLSDEDLIKRIRFGDRAVPYLQMPAFDENLSKTTIKNLVKYLRTIEDPKKKLAGLTPRQREKQFENPFERGRIYYLRFCSPCHGISGDGKGWAATRSGGKPIAHNDPVVMSKYTTQQIYEHVRGLRKSEKRNMPVFTGSIKPSMVKDIAGYTKTLPENVLR
ncbi:MAG: c-type cytochrome [Nitrospinota bacterium]